MTANKTTGRVPPLPPRNKLLNFMQQEQVVERFGSVGGWKGEATVLERMHAAGVAGWLEREYGLHKHFHLEDGQVSLRKLLDDAYSCQA